MALLQPTLAMTYLVLRPRTVLMCLRVEFPGTQTIVPRLSRRVVYVILCLRPLLAAAVKATPLLTVPPRRLNDSALTLRRHPLYNNRVTVHVLLSTPKVPRLNCPDLLPMRTPPILKRPVRLLSV